MPDEDKTFSGSLVLVLRIWWRHLHTLHWYLRLHYWPLFGKWVRAPLSRRNLDRPQRAMEIEPEFIIRKREIVGNSFIWWKSQNVKTSGEN